MADGRVSNVLGICHGQVMAMSDFMATAMGLPCYGHDHAMFAVLNMVMVVSSSWPCHSQGKSDGESHGLGTVRAKALSLARVMSLAKVSDSG